LDDLVTGRRAMGSPPMAGEQIVQQNPAAELHREA
jgi:hypothetical protein